MNVRRFDGVFPIAGLLLALPGLALGQSLTLASGSAQPGDTIPLNFSLSGTSAGTQPASLQFTLTYNAADFSAVAVALGAVATNAGKSVTCNPSSGQVDLYDLWHQYDGDGRRGGGGGERHSIHVFHQQQPGDSIDMGCRR